MTCLCPSSHYPIKQNWRRWIAVSLMHVCRGSEDAFTQLLQLILSEKVFVDYQVYTLSQFNVIMQYVMYIVAIMCVVLYVYVAEWKHH